MTDAALAADVSSADTLRLVCESCLIAGGLWAMVELQGQLHDYVVARYRQGSRGSAIGAYWEHLPAWATL